MSSRETEGNNSGNEQEHRTCEPDIEEATGQSSASHNHQAVEAGTSEQRETVGSSEGRTSECTDDVIRFPRRKLSLRGRQYRRRSGVDESSGDEHMAVSYLVN